MDLRAKGSGDSFERHSSNRPPERLNFLLKCTGYLAHYYKGLREVISKRFLLKIPPRFKDEHRGPVLKSDGTWTQRDSSGSFMFPNVFLSLLV